ncbi:MAG: TolC family protein [Calditrichaeota bacterium]|nr:MAG: TolC family protein [Calditrichota bacterium]MBL1204795.1 TolC family protein [Calditrichota bacterium]NOG44624.1 TolC family protein [Calditrichota bacterium]
MKFSRLFILIIFGINLLSAQEIHHLSLQECIDIAKVKSFSIRHLTEEYKVAKANLTAATNRFKTQVDLNFSLPEYNETIASFDDTTGRTIFFSTKQSRYSTDLTISQPLPTDGHIFIQSGIFHIQDISNELNSFRLNTRIGFNQPIEAFYSYNNILSALKNAELNFELTNRQLTRTGLDLNYQTSQAYYFYLSAIETQNIAKQTLDQQTESNNLAQNKYKAGVIAEVEALQMEVDLVEAKNNWDLAQQRSSAQANNLKQLLGISLSDSIILESDLSFQQVDVDLETALQFGLKNRLEIREREIAYEQAQINIERTKVDGQITGNISAFYDLIGVNEEDKSVALQTNFQSAWQELKRRPGNRGVALQLRIPLWDWGVNNAQVRAAEARLRQRKLSSDEEKINVEKDIRNTVNNIKSSLKRLKMLEKNIKVAERSFEISRNRFANGEINSQSLALDRNRLSSAYQSRLSALIDYKLLLQDITRKTFYDFVNGFEIKSES